MLENRQIGRFIGVALAVVSHASLVDASEVTLGNCTVSGATQLSDETISEFLSPIIENGVFPTSCAQAARALEARLRDAGAFAARVYIEPADGTPNILLRVVEGRLAIDGIKLGRSSARIDDSVVLEQTTRTLVPGSTLTGDKYERAILLLNDLPGVKGSEATVYPAENEDEANFEVHPQDGELVEGHLYSDNFGSAFTGEYRVGAAVDVNSPFRKGEKVTLGANVSDMGTYYLSLDASMPLSDNGLRGGISASVLDYRTDEADDLRGYSREGSAYLHYPIIRSRRTNLYGEVRVGRENMKDEDDTSTVTDRHVDTAHLKISGDRADGALGGGTSQFSLEGMVGYLDLGGYEPYRQEDQESARTNGRFSRLAWSASRLQHISGPWQGYVEVAGQLASKRLDSSQSISFGGPYDFPGYKSGEVMGDEGQRLHVDLRYNGPQKVMNAQWQVSAFYNIGHLTTHAKEFAGNVITPGIDSKSYTLQSTGVGFSLMWPTVKFQGAVGSRINNKIPDNLLDGDTDDDVHGWVQLVYDF